MVSEVFQSSTCKLSDFHAFKTAFAVKDEFDSEVGNALIKSMHNHSWYLSPKVVVLALADPGMHLQDKLKVIEQLLRFPIPEDGDIAIGKPEPVLILPDTEIQELVTSESWFLFKILELSEEVRVWYQYASLSQPLENLKSFQSFCFFVDHLAVTNDCSERNICLIQNYVQSSTSEDQRQNILLVVREERKTLAHTFTQENLENLKS
jgi:hypothetical protein